MARTPAAPRLRALRQDVKARSAQSPPYMPVGDKQVVRFFTECGYEVCEP